MNLYYYKEIKNTIFKSFNQPSILELVKTTKKTDGNNWNWKQLTLNKHITKKDILDNLYLSWDFTALCESDKMDINFLNELISRCVKLDWDKLSTNLNIKFKDIVKYNYYNWNWQLISLRNDLDIEILEKNINLPWNWEKLSLNNRITTTFVIKHQDKEWDFNALSRNNFLETEKTFMKADINWRRKFCTKVLLEKYNSGMTYIIDKYIGI